MSKKLKGVTKAIKVLKDASKSSSGKESKLEKSAKKIEDMKKDPKFIRLRKRANEIRKKKGLPPKPEFSKGGMLIEGLKKLAGKEKKKSRNKKSTAELRNKATKDFFEKANSSRPDLEAKAKRKKKMETERPAIPTMRKDMKRKPVKKSKGGMVTKWEQKWG